jgi:hypothetical protein
MNVSTHHYLSNNRDGLCKVTSFDSTKGLLNKVDWIEVT